MSDETPAGANAAVRLLPMLLSDPARSARVRAQGRASITRHGRWVQPSSGGGQSAGDVLATAFVGALSVLYLLAVAFNAMRVYGVPGT